MGFWVHPNPFSSYFVDLDHVRSKEPESRRPWRSNLGALKLWSFNGVIMMYRSKYTMKFRPLRDFWMLEGQIYKLDKQIWPQKVEWVLPLKKLTESIRELDKADRFAPRFLTRGKPSSEALEGSRGHAWTRRVTHVHSTSLVKVWPLARVDFSWPWEFGQAGSREVREG